MDRTPRELLDDVLRHTTVQQVADRLGVHNVTVYRWIAGAREIVDYRHVDALRALSGEARAYGYADPQPVDPEDARAALQREFVQAVKAQEQIIKRLEAL